MIKAIKILLLLGLCYDNSAGQSFQWSVPISPVSRSGFYAIPLTPSILAVSKADFSDIRLFADQGPEIPYLIQKDEGSFDKSHFQPFEIESKELLKKCCTKIIIANKNQQSWNNFCLIVKNHEMSKSAILSGSDDKENWFALREDLVLSPINSADKTFGTCYLSFPLADYRFFSLTINDSTTSPLNIQQIGHYDSEVQFGKYQQASSPTMIHADSIKLKRTYVSLTFDASYTLDKLKFHFEGPKFFSRQAILYAIEKDKKGRKQQSEITSFLINSSKENILQLQEERHKEYLLEIVNGDNPTLKVKSLEAWQLNTKLVAYLESGKNYYLKMGNPGLTLPDYDLSSFTDSIHGDLPELATGSLVKKVDILQENKKPDVLKTVGFFQNKAWIWSAILIVVMLLGWMSYRMINDLGKSE